MTMAAIDFQLLANAGFPPASYQPGEIIFAAGDKGDNMYVIRSGEVEVERDGKIVETLSAGGIFGEMALIDGSPRRGEEVVFDLVVQAAQGEVGRASRRGRCGRSSTWRRRKSTPVGGAQDGHAFVVGGERTAQVQAEQALLHQDERHRLDG